jgi:hypothetical protein
MACGDYERARASAEESHAILCRSDTGGILASLGILARVASYQGDDAMAQPLYEQMLAIQRVQGDRRGVASCLESLASIAIVRQKPIRAARLFGAAAALRDALPATTDCDENDRQVALLRARLGEEAFAGAWAAGRAMTSNEAIEEALAE